MMNQFNIWNNASGLNHQQQEDKSLSSQGDLSPDLLISKLNNLSSSSNYNNFLQNLEQPQSQSQQHSQQQSQQQTYQYTYQGMNNYHPNQQQLQPFPVFNYESSYQSDFNLPLELQGGLSNIQSRRPSFAAELAQNNISNGNHHTTSLEQIAFQNNHQFNNNMMNFRSRRPSIQIQSQFQQAAGANSFTQQQHQQKQQQQQQQQQQQVHLLPNIPDGHHQTTVELDNGLLLHNGGIITSPILQQIYETTKNYFSVYEAAELYDLLQQNVQSNEIISKIIINLKKLNNLFNLMKPLVLVLTKSGKFEILSTPLNSNLKIQSKDVVICDGDRGKDMVYVLDGNLNLEMAILINYLKKKQHVRAISYSENLQNGHSQRGSSDSNGMTNTVEDLLSGNGILDEETQFQIPSKQILRFATPQEIFNLKFKLVEEIKSYKTAVLKINQNADLKQSLEILNSEYQFDQKKLTFYYRSNKRLDFRSLIKELFKIYKTRIWLCAVVNYNQDGAINHDHSTSHGPTVNGNLDTLELTTYKSDPFHVHIFEKLFRELLAL